MPVTGKAFDEAKALAKETGLPVEQVLNDALEQGLETLRSAYFFRARRGKGDLARALEILRNAGKEPPLPGDEIPEELVAGLVRERK